jgi:glycosyltransferase involved in cell wall biosynthesis
MIGSMETKTPELMIKGEPARPFPTRQAPQLKILIMHRDSDVLGGVEKYFLKMRDKFTEPKEYFTMGRRPGEEGSIAMTARMISDYWRFIVLLMRRRFDLIHMNPSIDQKSFFRDGIFHLICKLFRQKTLIFFRGWYTVFEATIRRHPWLFRLFYAQADGFIVLSSEYENLIREWGARSPVFREVAVADDAELREFDIEKTLVERERANEWRLLFAARVTRDKGIYELAQAVSLLQKEVENVKLIVAGDSPEINEVKKFINDLGIEQVVFAGYVTGEEKDLLFKTSHVFCLPTYYEGFPNAVVEAMAVGLPIVTRSVGGLKDFFVSRTHGFITDSKDPAVFAGFLRELITNPSLYKQISYNNYRYSQENFLASRAAARLQEIYKSVAAGV